MSEQEKCGQVINYFLFPNFYVMNIILCISIFLMLQEDGDPPVNESLSIENTLWASTVVASGKYLTGGVAVQEVTRTSCFDLNLSSNTLISVDLH